MRLGADARHPCCYIGCHATERPRIFLATDPHNVKVTVLLEASTRVRESLVIAAQRPVKGDVPSVGHITAQYHLAALDYILVAWRGVEVEVVLLARFRHRYKVCKEDEDENQQGATPRGTRQRASHACNVSVLSKDGCNLHCVRSESCSAAAVFHTRTHVLQSVGRWISPLAHRHVRKEQSNHRPGQAGVVSDQFNPHTSACKSRSVCLSQVRVRTPRPLLLSSPSCNRIPLPRNLAPHQSVRWFSS